MKGLKIFAFVVGGVVVLAAILFALALTPSIQTWAVRKAVAGQPGATIAVARVAGGLSAAEVTELRYAKEGMVVTAKGVSAKYSAMDYLTKKRINIDSLIVDDLVIDLRSSAPAPGAGAASPTGKTSATKTHTAENLRLKSPPGPGNKTPFEGLLKEAQLPFDLRVAHLAAKGRLLLPDNQTVMFDLKGSGIEPGQRGKVEWTVDFADSTAGAMLRGLRATGDAAIRIAANRRIDLVELETTAAAMGPKISAAPVKLTVKAEKPAAGDDENYTTNISLLRGNALESIVKTEARYLAASHEIAGAWEIALRSEQLAGLLAGLGLPELAASGSGKFTFKPDTSAISTSGDLQAQTAQLEKIAPALAAIGPVHLKTTFDGGLADNVARLDRLNLEVAGSDGRKFAQISSLQKITYTLADQRIALVDPKAELARISLQALPLAWLQAFVKPIAIESGDVSVVLAMEAEPDGSRIRARAVEPLTLRSVTVRQGDKKLADQVSLTTRLSVDYSATKILGQLADLSVTMPAGDSVAGNLSADISNLSTTPAIGFAAQLQAKVIHALQPYLPLDPGPLAITANLEGRYEGQTLQLTKATKTVNRDGGALLVAFELQQPVRADVKAGTFAVANANATAARLRLGEIPLAWAETFVPKSKFAGSLKGATLDVAIRSVDDLTVTTAEPFTLRGVTASLDGKAMLQAVDLSASLSATKHGDTLTYTVQKIDVKQGEIPLAAMSVSGEAKLGAKMTVTAKGNLEADAAALMTQPVLAPFATLSRGRVATAFEANIGDTVQAKAVISAKNLVAKQENRALGDLEMTLTANVKADGSGSLTLPLTLTNGSRRSDLSIDGAFGKASNKETFLFTGKIASNQLIVEDFEPLAALAPAEKPTASTPPPARGPTPPRSTPPPSTSPPTRDTAPFWKGVNGKAEVDLKRIVYGKDYIISGVRGTAVITDTKLSLDGLEGRFKENPFKVAGGVTFSPQLPKPYALIGSVDVANFDVGEFLRATNPTEKPALETKATVSAKLNGNGANLADLGKNAFGKFELSGTKGMMYLLERKGGAGTAVNALALGLGILGAARGSDTASSLGEIAKLLNAVPFDSMKMQVERGSDLTFKLTSLEVLSPILRTTGTGAVASKSTDDLANAPMNIVLQLGAKGELAYLLKRANLLPQTQQEQKLDEKGYELMSRTFTIGGTPAKPDNSAFWKLLGEAALGAFVR